MPSCLKGRCAPWRWDPGPWAASIACMPWSWFSRQMLFIYSMPMTHKPCSKYKKVSQNDMQPGWLGRKVINQWQARGPKQSSCWLTKIPSDIMNTCLHVSMVSCQRTIGPVRFIHFPVFTPTIELTIFFFFGLSNLQRKSICNSQHRCTNTLTMVRSGRKCGIKYLGGYTLSEIVTG